MELKNTEKQEHSVVALTIEITKAEFEAAKDKAFKNQQTSPFRASRKGQGAAQDDREAVRRRRVL